MGDMHCCIDGFTGTGKLSIIVETASITLIKCTLVPPARAMEETYCLTVLGYACIRGL